MGILSYGYKAIKSIKPKTKMSKGTKIIKEGQADVSKRIAKGSKEDPKLAAKYKELGNKTKSDMTKSLLKYNKKRKGMMGGGMMGRPMYKKGSKKAVGKSSLGMQSVIHGLDSNPKITAADPKAKFIAKNKKA